jgi:uncharacterized protein
MHATAERFVHHDVQEHLIESSVIAQTYTIRVMQPMRLADGSERFPVLYATDSDDFFGGYSNLAYLLQGFGETPRFILVGIGYANPHAAEALRLRDFLTHDIRARLGPVVDQIADSPLVSGLDDLGIVTKTTDAQAFLRFVREELMPFVEHRYPIVPSDNSYCGYSAGGTFGLYTLFTQPRTFKRYILGSASTSYDGHNFGIDLAGHFLRSGDKLSAKVFMSVGELEEFKDGLGQFDLVSGHYLFVKYMKSIAIPGLDLRTCIFPNETHATSWTLAFCHGLKALFGPADEVPFVPAFLRK